MACWHNVSKLIPLLGLVLLIVAGLAPSTAKAENEGRPDLDEAMRVKINATGLREISQTVDLLQRGVALSDEPDAGWVLRSAVSASGPQ